MYSARQRDLRERRTRAARGDEPWPRHGMTAIDIDGGRIEHPLSFRLRLSDRASAA